MADRKLPARADVVVIGGGIAGLSALYHLAREGVTNTVLLERRQLACGTTWHSVGSVGQVRGSRLLTLLSSRTAQMLPELEQETGLATGYKRYGSIGLALNAERLEEFKRTVSIARAWGHDAAILTGREVKERYPEVEVADVLGALYLPGDGRTNPVDTVQALAKACRQRGARIFEDTKVEEIVVEEGRIRGVRTSSGDITAEKVLLSAGMWSRELAERIGVTIPLLAAEHFYAVTEPIPSLPRDTPMVRVPDERTYYKEDAGKLLFGCLEEVAKPWGMSGIPEAFCFDSLPEDLEHFGPILETAMRRMPLLKEAGIKLFFNGPESFTPDGSFHLGETAEVEGLYVSCGFNTIGVMASGGIGMMAAQLIAQGKADWDVSGFDIRRAARFESNISYLADRNIEGLGKLYGLQCPDQPYASARNIRLSPLHAHQVAQNAVMDHVAGWERAAVFAPASASARMEATYARQAWHDWCANECEAVRERAAVIDQSALAKLLMVGRDAAQVLSAQAGRMPEGEAPACRTLLLSPDGRIEGIVQIVRLAADRLLVLGPIGDEVRLEALLRRRLPAGSASAVIDVTAGYSILDIIGPQARTRLSDAGLRLRAASLGVAPMADIGYAVARAIDGGEHGLDVTRLLIDTNQATHVYDRLRAVGVTSAGAWALRALRIEAGHPAWGVEIDATMTPAAAGLSHLCAGAGSSEASVLATVLLDEAGPLLIGREPIRFGGKAIGWMLSASFGTRDRRSAGIAVVTGLSPKRGADVAVEVEIAGKACGARLRPLPG